jgi:RNA polymerase sigma-54 factor
MQAVADLVGVHRSTVSRAVAGKYAWTPWGVFELRYFFQSAAGAGPARRPGEVAGAEMGAPEGSAARDDLRALVERIVAAEDRREPLSDEAIVASLAERGYRVARRTVAKYRRELGIPSSYRRRDHLA